jgi:serine/threonine-protein kinase RsbW
MATSGQRTTNTVNAPFYTNTFPSTTDAMGPVLKDALDALITRGWVAKDSTFHAHLCLEEAIVNAVVHGNQGEAWRSVRLDLAEEEGQCIIRVWDEGAGPQFDPDKVRLPDGCQQGGRGVCIMRFFMDDVEYDTNKHCLVMRIRRNGAHHSPPGQTPDNDTPTLEPDHD